MGTHDEMRFFKEEILRSVECSIQKVTTGNKKMSKGNENRTMRLSEEMTTRMRLPEEVTTER